MDNTELLFIGLLSAVFSCVQLSTTATAPLASKQTMHPCESPLLFVFWYLPHFPFSVLNCFHWLKQPSRFTLHPHLLLLVYVLHVYCITWWRILRLRMYGVILSYFYYTIHVDEEFYLPKPRLQNNLVWCGQALSQMHCMELCRVIWKKQINCCLTFTTSPHLLQLLRRMLQHCFAVKLQKCFWGLGNLTWLSISKGLSQKITELSLLGEVFTHTNMSSKN